MAGKMQFEQLLESRTVKYAMFDITWCGGMTEARKIAVMADAFQLPISPHTAGGPLLFYASTHLTTSSPNVWIQERCQLSMNGTGLRCWKAPSLRLPDSSKSATNRVSE